MAAEGAKGLVTDIHRVKQEIISYRKIIKPQRPTLRQLERSIERFLPGELELYFDDLVDASERIWDLLDNYKEVVEALEDTNESLISHQQNDILYVLTVFIVVLTPLTFITGFFGMNVGFPGLQRAARVLRLARVHGRDRRRHARLLPLEAVAVMQEGDRRWPRRPRWCSTSRSSSAASCATLRASGSGASTT